MLTGLNRYPGAHHRKQRKMLNPVFSIKHMRMMTPIFYDVAHKVNRVIPKSTLDTIDVTNLGLNRW